MANSWKQIFSWRLKLILLIGGMLGIAVAGFSFYVAKMDDSPNGTSPLSWGFKSKSQGVPEFFRVDENIPMKNTSAALSLPSIDRITTKETEFALFALG